MYYLLNYLTAKSPNTISSMSTVKQKKALACELCQHSISENLQMLRTETRKQKHGKQQTQVGRAEIPGSSSVFTCSWEQVHQVIAAKRGILPNNAVDLMKGPEPNAVSKSWRLARQWGADKMRCAVLSYLALSGLVSSWRLKAFHNWKTTLEQSCSLDSHLHRKRKNGEST